MVTTTITTPTLNPVQSRPLFLGNLHPPYHVLPPPRPWRRTQHRAPARFIDAQGAGCLATHSGHRRVQATAARIVSIQLAEIHATSAAATSHRNEVCRRSLGARFFVNPSVAPLPANRSIGHAPNAPAAVDVYGADAVAVRLSGNCSSRGPLPSSKFG